MNKRKITVAVTGLNAIDSPGPGISVIRALKESNVYDCRIIGLSYDAMEPGIYMHEWVDKTYQIPLPSAGQEALYHRMEQICALDAPEVLIPNFDAELFNFIKLEKRLKKELGINTLLPSLDQFESRHKVNLNEFGEKHGLLVPQSKTIFQLSELSALFPAFDYPMVIKGKFYDAVVVNSYEQAVAAFNKISAKWGLPIIIQEYVSGTEVNVTGLGDGKGNLIGAIPMRKLYITDKGKAWAGISLDDEKLLDITRSMVKSCGWKGGFELEIMKTNKGQYYLMEINPRFPAWVYLSVGAGQNHPEALVKMALGEEVRPFEKYHVGKLFIRYSYDMIVGIEEFEQISTLGEL